MTAGWKDIGVPKPYPREFRADVVRVALDREPGVSAEQIANDSGVHPMTLFKWLRQAGTDASAECGVSRSELAELREARKGIKLLEQENGPGRGVSVTGEPAGKRHYPLVNELAADGIPVACRAGSLNIARQPYYRWLAHPVTDAELAANVVTDGVPAC